MTVGPRLRIARRYSPLQAVLPAVRTLTISALIIALIVGGTRFLLLPESVGALEFTPRLINTTQTAIGINSLVAVDINGDDKKDIISAGSDGVKVYQQGSKNTFLKTTIADVKAQQLFVADFDADGAKDILVTLKEGNPSVRWYRNLGDLQFSGTDIGTGASAKAGVGDLDGDGSSDIAIAYDSSGLIVLQRWMNNGSGTFTGTTLSADSKVTALTVGNINGDKYADIVIGGTNGLQRWYTNDGIAWTRSDIDESNLNKTVIAVGDVNGDDKVDIVTGDQDKNKVALYSNVDNSTWSRSVLEGDPDVSSVAIGDLDNDGEVDIAAASQDDNDVYWYRNLSGTFTKSTIAEKLQSVPAVIISDISGDGNNDFVTADHFRGRVYYYQRIFAKPKATAADNIAQSTDSSGRITFTSTISDSNQLRTRLRIQYSVDGVAWHKPWLTKVTANTGTIDLKNSNGYQVGTTNPIDTDLSDVELTFTWDTKSVENTGGPFVGDISNVRLRLIPKDDKSVGTPVISSLFKVDNQVPTGLGNATITSLTSTEASLSWTPASDASSVNYVIYYGTSSKDVAEKKSSKWDSDKDEKLGSKETNSITIPDITSTETYYFKIFARDAFGNEAASASVSGTPGESGPDESPIPTSPTPEPTTTVEPTTEPEESVIPSPSPDASLEPTLLPTIVLPPPPTNKVPIADAGPDQVVNLRALVILDGTASADPEGDSLSYSWRQLSGSPVELLSDRTTTPSFSADQESGTYIFALTVKDTRGASATDTVTVATKSLAPAPVASVTVTTTNSTPPTTPSPKQSNWITRVALPSDIILLIVSLLSTLISLAERGVRSLRQRSQPGVVLRSSPQETPKGKVVHYKSGEPIAGVDVLIYGGDGKLRATQRTNNRGEFQTLLPAGEYTLGVQAPGFVFTPPASNTLKPEAGILYAGGKITIADSNRPIDIVIPMKPTGVEISSSRVRFLHTWQSLQHISRVMSWPLFLAGAMLNTVLIFLVPSFLYLIFEFIYVVLVIVKVSLEIRIRPAYGLVRDAITHVPLDLAVVRLFESGTNRLVMTRVANAQGKFFALPPAGTYTITVTKPGYGVFSKDKITINTEQDSTLQLTADLMPVAPMTGLAQARAAVL